jgi:hypothetical protein
MAVVTGEIVKPPDAPVRKICCIVASNPAFALHFRHGLPATVNIPACAAALSWDRLTGHLPNR